MTSDGHRDIGQAVRHAALTDTIARVVIDHRQYIVQATLAGRRPKDPQLQEILDEAIEVSAENRRLRLALRTILETAYPLTGVEVTDATHTVARHGLMAMTGLQESDIAEREPQGPSDDRDGTDLLSSARVVEVSDTDGGYALIRIPIGAPQLLRMGPVHLAELRIAATGRNDVGNEVPL